MGIDVVRLQDWLLTFHKIPYTPWTIGYFPKGPKPTKEMIEKLTQLGKQKKAIFIQLEPNVLDGNVPLRPSHHPLFTKYTFVLDLTKSEDTLLAAMHPKTRYNIRVAQKHGVVVGEHNDAFESYLALTKETTSRQGFYAHNETYHRTMWDIMRKAGIAHLFTASYHGEILSAWIVFVYGDTVYYPYGASSRSHREVMAPTLMLWEIARWAKKKGLKKFDLWGALGPTPDENDPWYGFHRFKQGFNPRLVEFIGSYDLVINAPLYTLYTIADTIRWGVLHGAATIFHLR
ncbi:MAG: femAB family protein [Microgenomates group bacterium GW2011_GWC1_49_7]|nr:MAG: femAB family protein [Microgenomates group bacterium GW2011_GWC1_49_7]